MALPGMTTQTPLAELVDFSSRHVANNNTSTYHHDKAVVNTIPNITSTMYPGNLSMDPRCYGFVTNDTDINLAHQIFLYASTSLVVTGLIGNGLSVAVFSSKEMRNISSNVYLLVLALSDSMYLVSVFLAKLLTTLRCLHLQESDLDVINSSNIVCQLLQLLVDFFSDYSSCLILAFTVERYIACYLPVRFKDLCTVQRAKMACLFAGTVIILYISPFHFLYMGVHEVYGVCIIDLENETIFTILYIIEATVFRVVPVAVIAVLNVFIILRVTQVARDKRKRKSHVKSLAQNKKPKKEDRSMQLTIMLILVSTTYVIFYMPALVQFLIHYLQVSGLINVSKKKIDIAYEYSKTLYIFGFAINFFLYTMSGRVFREQLEMILCEKRLKERQKSLTTTETTTLV